jgi:hypothetical protein
MTNKNGLITLFAAGILASTVAAHAQSAPSSDPNFGESPRLSVTPGTAANGPELAGVPDPNFGTSVSGSEAEIPGDGARGPQLAVAPDPNLAPSTNDEVTNVQPAMHAGAGSGSMEPVAQ